MLDYCNANGHKIIVPIYKLERCADMSTGIFGYKLCLNFIVRSQLVNEKTPGVFLYKKQLMKNAHCFRENKEIFIFYSSFWMSSTVAFINTQIYAIKSCVNGFRKLTMLDSD